jgi:hypothetical protein
MTQKIRCATCGQIVATLDGAQLTFDRHHVRRRRSSSVDADDYRGTVTYDLDDRLTSLNLDVDDAQCRGRCGTRYSLRVLVAAARRLRQSGQASTKVRA